MYEEEPEMSETKEEGVTGIMSESRSEKKQKWGIAYWPFRSRTRALELICMSREVCDTRCAEE